MQQQKRTNKSSIYLIIKLFLAPNHIQNDPVPHHGKLV
jgi:hypothetical protein